ncbi:carboxymuconolactone decarboxylase family protein [Microbacterium sp. DT81.1]|uniref:carboxymuconolactone decarboxylase family protein n=1 Tax=Microbacterium sp. DT81.1 TaxID=3393413 RepID=UPI003CEB74F6
MPNYQERLRRISLNDPRVLDDGAAGAGSALDPKTLAIARLASLIAVGGSEPSFGEQTDAALSAGATTDEIVDVLIGVSSIVGEPRVVSAAPLLALALGLDVDAILD